jgi:magnesium chelatase accessory protein
MPRDRPLWDDEGRDWPNRESSRFVTAGGIDWHVQVMGDGPALLLLHGTGAATHSWRGLAPLLAPHFTLVAPDLPGHGFTSLPERRRLSLNGMAAGVAALLGALKVAPEFAVGHSAGAAIALRMALDGTIAPKAVVSLNGALLPFPGLGAIAFPALAKLLFLNPFAAPFLSRRAGAPGAVTRLIEGTGSRLDEAGLDFYARLFRTERHVAAAGGMMANWDLRPLKADLKRLAAKLTLVSAERDKAVPASVALEVAGLVPGAKLIELPGLGHLAHEENPATVARMIRAACA